MTRVRFGFTAIDKDLIGNNRFADPLGIQPIWSYFGRALVPNMTEQTRYASGFYMLICIFYFYDKYKEWVNKQENEKTISIEYFYILTEQMFAYATYEKEQKWELPGAMNLKYFYKNKIDAYQVLIGLKRELMGSQLATGTWGLYRGATIRSKILNESGRSLTDEFRDQFDADSLSFGVQQYKELFSIVQRACNAPDKSTEFGLKTGLCESIYISLKNMSKNKKLLRKYLIENHGILADVSEKLVVEDVSDDYRKFIVNCETKWYKENSYIFEDIIRCEDYVATLDSVLMFLYNYEGNTIKSVCEKLPIKIEELKNAYTRFKDIKKPPTKGVVAQRYNLFLSNFEADTKERLVEWLLYLHNQIVTSRGGSPWIELINRKIIIHNEYSKSDILKVTPGTGWINPYYLDTLTSVYKGLR